VRRLSRTSLGAIGGGVVLAATLFTGFAPAGAAAPTSSTDPLSALTTLPVSIALPITTIGNVIASTVLPIEGATTGSNSTTQTSPLANASVPVNVCSVSAGVLADASSSCSTTSVGTGQDGAIGNVNVPITANDNAVGLLGEAASALGLNSTTSSASTTQSGLINASAPVTLCAINAGVDGNTTSDCDTTGTNGTTTQAGLVDAAVHRLRRHRRGRR
jgi:hypothetical protein